MATFVLVHGAMHGGWCWREVGALLTGRGHRVYAPSLCGQGERRGQLTPEVGLGTHVADLVDLLWFEDLAEVHLVLHSYAGVLAGPVAQRAGDRLASVTFAGAFLTDPGQCLLDVEPPETAARYRQQVAVHGEGWYVPASATFLDQWGVPERLRLWVGPRLTDFPFRCLTEPADYDPAPLTRVRKIYLRHTRPPLPSLAPFAERAATAGWRTYEIACGHDLMLEDPHATAGVLAAVAAL